MMSYPNRPVEPGETHHFMTDRGGRDTTVGQMCGSLNGRWYCVPCVEHVPYGGYVAHMRMKPLSGRQHRMVWDCKLHGPEARS